MNDALKHSSYLIELLRHKKIVIAKEKKLVSVWKIGNWGPGCR